MRVLLLIGLSAILTGFAGYAGSQTVPAAAVGTPIDSALYSQEFFAGLKAKTLGNSDAALSHFANCARLLPSRDAAWYELAILHYSRGAHDEALDMINKAIAINDREPWYLGLKADLLQKTGKKEELVQTFDRLIALQPDYLDHYYNKADALLGLSRYAEALTLFNEIESFTGPNPELTLARQRVYEKQGNTRKALEAINELIRKFPAEVRYYLIQGETYDAARRRKKAMRSFKKALEIEPEHGYARLAIADHYRSRGKYKDAFEELKKAFRSPALHIDVKVKILLNNYLKPAGESKNWGQAEQLADILMKVYPGDARPYAVAGDILLQQNKKEEARRAYRKAVQFEKNILLLWEQLLRLELPGENFREIARISEEALRYFPEQADFYLFHGVSEMHLGNYQDAIVSLNKGLDLASEKALKLQFYSNLGDAYHAVGDHAASDKAFDAALKLDGSNSLVMNNYAYYLALREQHLEKAQRMSRESIKLDPDNLSYHDTYAWVLYKAGRYEEACKWIEKAIDGYPHSPTFWEHYGDILYRLGEESEALNKWQKARDLGGNSQWLDKKIREKALYE